MPLSRRSFVLAAAASLFASPALAAHRHHARHKSTASKSAQKAVPTPVPKLTGNALPIPPQLIPGPNDTWELKAGPVTQTFLPGKPTNVSGYNGLHLGPTIRLTRGSTTKARLVNALSRPTNVHWHGLLVDSPSDGALTSVAPGESWDATLAVDQPAATLWYHAHVHGSVGADMMDGLAGLMIIDDPTAPTTLPSAYGIDDFPLILQDKTFDDAGKPVYHPDAEVIGHGFRGKSIVVNGIVDPLLKVPQRLVRVRLLNAANSRTFRLYMEDERSFDLIATDGGYLPTPAQIDTLILSPGERAEILIDFADGSSSLLSTPDNHEHRMGDHVMVLPDTFEKPFRVIGFEAVKDQRETREAPETLPAPAAPPVPPDVKHRRFTLDMGPTAHAHQAAATPAKDPHAGHVMPGGTMPGHDMSKMAPGQAMPGHTMPAEAAGPALTINGKAFAMGRIDETVPFGASEIWEIVTPQMAHSFHVHGAQFRVLSEDGGTPRAWNRGPKDTIFVENSAEVLVTFNRHAAAAAPFLYHCHMLEHEDGGMMGTFTVA